ncbi:mandelate racemase/muconate lactonizing enzyme family protein [Pacificoceanicola onchidii]|uniref:mandelate racemase/muconate lactonizing enzyme family protein n=1 Tax=Pacificoceanicola onchidii TaxID=2562685 RepID=UPI0010A624F8|nr:mandelate racemase/muconate lactonizing enzyme family protein [Pacificoceanicola onchidii]
MQPALALDDKGFTQTLTLDTVGLYPLRAAGGISPSMALGTMPTRPALLVSLTDSQGCIGWGEVWANFPPRANLHKAHLIQDVVVPKLAGLRFTEPREAISQLRETLSVYFLHIGQEQVFEHILAGLDTALWDLALRSAGRSFAEHMQVSPRAQSYASSLNPDDLDEKLAEHGGYGQRHFKLKLGFGDDADCAFVARAARACPPGGHLMVDSNQSWDLSRATRMLDRLAPNGLLFAEEPMPANAPLSEWEALARASDIPLAAGENIYGINNFLAMAEAGVRILQPDVAKWGGLSGACDLARALPDGVQLWPHFMGTAVGQMAALSIAAAVGDSSVCEMDVNANVLRTELCGGALGIDRGAVALPAAPGLVTPPRTELLERLDETRK